MKRRKISGTLLGGTVILGGGIVISKVIGAVYRIPLARLLGGEGIGVYQMVFPIYALLLTLSSSAIPTSLAKVISENLARGEGKRAIGIYRVARRYIFVISLIFAVLLGSFGDDFARWQGSWEGGLAYISISPSVVIVGFVATMRGKFQGMNNMVPTALSQIFEQVGKLVFSISLPMLFGDGVAEKVALAILGVTLSECVGLGVLVFYSWRSKRRKFVSTSLAFVWNLAEEEMSRMARVERMSVGRVREYISPLLKIALPMTISLSILPATGILESSMIVNILSGMGERGVEQFGVYSGGLTTMMSMPLGVCVALGTAFIPSISGDIARGKKMEARRKISVCIKGAMVVAIVVSVAFLVLPRVIARVLFGGMAMLSGGLLEGLLRWSFLNVLLGCFSGISSSILYAMSREKTPLVGQVLGSVLRFLVSGALMFRIGIYGCVVGVFFGNAVPSAINFFAINKALGKSFSLRPLACGVLCGLVLAMLMLVVSQGGSLTVFSVAWIFACGCAFVFLMIFLGYFSKEEVSSVVKIK